MSEPTELTIAVTSFEDLYLREYPGLIAVASALSGHDGEDLVQDAMVRALVNWEKERPRLAVALFYAGDRTISDIAGVLGVPEGTVRSDLSRARSFMLGRMGAQDDEQ